MNLTKDPPPLQRPGILWHRDKKYSEKETEAHFLRQSEEDGADEV